MLHSKYGFWSLCVFLPNALIPSFCLFLVGFDLCEVGQEEVVLKTGKQANRRTMHFALQSLLALFGKTHHLLMYPSAKMHAYLSNRVLQIND